jgi:hypothetical protein
VSAAALRTCAVTAASLGSMLAPPSAPRSLRPGARPRSLGTAPLTVTERAELRDDLVQLRRRGVYRRRPRVLGDCEKRPGPCPWISCRHHLYLEVDEDTGAVKLNFPDKEVWELAETCSLRAAARGGASLEEVGRLVNLSQERTSQLEFSGLAAARRQLRRARASRVNRKAPNATPWKLGHRHRAPRLDP